jgi:hypothetical protein
MAVFWVVAPCSLAEDTDDSDVLAASIVWALQIPKDSNPRTCRRDNLKSRFI